MSKVSHWTGIIVVSVLTLFAFEAHAAKKMATSKACLKKKWNKKRFSHRLYSSLLKKYVKHGKVNYTGLKKKRKKLDLYLCRLAHTNAHQLHSKRAKLAFWINAYNALTLRAVLDRLPRSHAAQKQFSVAAKRWHFWKGFQYQVSGKWYTLNQIENSVIRPKFREPRIHFALVCASIGCPLLSSKAYTASRLYRMLNRNTRRYLRSPRGAKLNRKNNVIHLSKLFHWYQTDFQQKPYKHYLLFVAKYLKKKDRKFVRKHYKSLKVKWLPYNWKLNVQ